MPETLRLERREYNELISLVVLEAINLRSLDREYLTRKPDKEYSPFGAKLNDMLDLKEKLIELRKLA